MEDEATQSWNENGEEGGHAKNRLPGELGAIYNSARWYLLVVKYQHPKGNPGCDTPLLATNQISTGTIRT